jgi:hypothetical protein
MFEFPVLHWTFRFLVQEENGLRSVAGETLGI